MMSHLRPKTTDELAQRLEKLRDDSNGNAHGPDHHAVNRNAGLEGEKRISFAAQETSALLALSFSMIEILAIEPKKSYALEAAKLSRFTSQENYKALFGAFINVMAHGTSDGNLLDARLLTAFNEVLCSPLAKVVSRQLPLGNAMQILTRRLETADFTTNDSEQYHLILSLSTVLDEMNEIKAQGISDEKIIQPLLTLLRGSCAHQDLRIAQAAAYAYQALLGIPSDVSPWKALAKETYKIIQGGAKLAGSVTALDPSRLFDSFEDLAHLPEVVSSIVEVVDMLERARRGINFQKKQATWYLGLRYTDLLIGCNAPQNLESLLENPKLSCRDDKKFLCGLCAQLEKAKNAPSPNNDITDCLERFLTPKITTLESLRLQEWFRLATNATKPLSLKKPTKSKKFLSILRPKPKSHSSNCTGWPPKQQPQETHSKLLEKGWNACSKAKLFYADQAIRNKYTSPEHELLKIERLSGESLPLDRCYINLSIVQESAESSVTDVGESSSIANHRPSYWDNYSKHQEVPLSDLFIQDNSRRGKYIPVDPPSASEEKDEKPIMRVLIRGQAGVGKSTLCKKIVHDFIYKGMWADDIDRIIWLPLRSLKGSKVKFIEDLFREQYFANTPDSQLLVDALCSAFQADETRTLFLVDGFDEVFTEVTGKSSDILLKVLEQPRTIITSRPYAVNHSRVGNIQRECDTIGFYPHQVREYIKTVAKDQADNIQAFIGSHPVIEGLARIPIQLDAICFSFAETALRGSVHVTTLSTMTELYQSVEQELWKKDVEMLEKKYNGEVVKKGYAKTVPHSSVRELVGHDINALRALAFTGLCKSMVEFDGEFLGVVFTKHQACGGDGRKLSFLRSSHGHPIEYDRRRSYHFLHLTFQEYFAAQYFVEHWKTNGKLEYAGPGTTAEEFLRKEKYNQRYDILWRFVAGLLHADADEQQLSRFFSIIEQDPHDLLGPGHQRLVMHCLGEIDSSRIGPHFRKLQEALEDQLKRWLLVECSPIKAKGRSLQLVADPEFPSHILAAVAREGSLAVKLSIMESLSPRPHLDLIVAEVKQCLLTELTTTLSDRICSILGRFKELGLELPLDVLQALVKQVESKTGKPPVTVLNGLELPLDVLHVMVKQLGSGNGYFAFTVLNEQPVLPEVILKGIADQLCNLDIQIRTSVADTMGASEPDGRQLSVDIAQAVASLLGHSDPSVRTIAVNILFNQKILPEVILQALAKLLEDSDQSLSALVFKNFGRRELSAPIDEIFARQLGNQNFEESLRLWVVKSLLQQSNLSEPILQGVVKQLGDLHGTIISHAASLLNRQQVLPETILQSIIKQLENLKPYGWDQSLLVLGTHSKIPEVILQVATERLLHPKAKRRLFTNVTSNATSEVPEATLRAKAAKLCRDKGGMVNWVIELLGQPGALPEDMIQAIIQQLDSADIDIKESAISALHGFECTGPVSSEWYLYEYEHKARLPETIIELICKNIDHPNSIIRDRSLELLEVYRNSIPDTILQNMVKELEVPPWRFKPGMRVILSQRLSAATVQAVAKLLDNSNTRGEAVEIIVEQPILPEAVLDDIWKHLDPLMPTCMGEALRILKDKHSVPAAALPALAKFLETAAPQDQQAVLDIVRPEQRLPTYFLQVLTSILESLDEDVQRDAAGILQLQDSIPDDILQSLVALLDNPSESTRRRASSVLEERNIPHGNLHVVAGLLYSSHLKTQELASDILKGQTTLPDAILHDLANLLEDSDSSIETKRLVMKLIPTNSKYHERGRVLTESLIQALAKQLQDVPEDISAMARAILCDPRAYPEAIQGDIERYLCYLYNPDAVGAAKERCQQLLLVDERICASVLTNMNDKVFNKVFRTWQGQSFVGHLVWYADGDMSYLQTSSGTQKLPFQALRHRVEKAHKFFNDPPPVNLDAVWES